MPNTDLWEQLTSGTFQANVKQAKKAKSKGKKEAEAALLRALGIPVEPVPSPWQAVALVLPVCTSICSCGEVHTSPAGPVLVRFQHKRNHSTIELEHPSMANMALPRMHKELFQRVRHCPACFHPREAEAFGYTPDLFSDPVEVPAYVPPPEDRTPTTTCIHPRYNKQVTLSTHNKERLS